MIDPKDLRIRNLVSCKVIGDTYTDRKPYYSECIYAVTGLRGGFVWLDIGHDAEQKVPCDNVQRITITEEWLKRAGFVRSTVFDSFWSLGIICIGLFANHNTLDLYDNDEDTSIELGINIEYVHQLQNLYFALTGEELQFKTQP